MLCTRRLRVAGGSTLAAATLATVAGCAQLGMAHVGMGVGDFRTTWTTGSCHRLDQLVETDGMFPSDTSPAVSCTGPHQSETFALSSFSGAAAAQPSRPSPLWLQREASGHCSWPQLAGYLGARSGEPTRDLSVLRIFPSADEWSRGERTIRCDVLVGPRTTAEVASVSEPLAGIMVRPGGARFRVCRTGARETSCDKPHEAEVVGSWDRDAGADAGGPETQCDQHAAAYLAVRLNWRPDLTIRLEPPGDASPTDAQSGTCWLSPADGRVMTGSLYGTGSTRLS